MGRSKARSPTGEEKRRDDIGDKFGSSEDRSRKDDIEAKFGGPAPKRANGEEKDDGEKPKKEKKDKKPPIAAPTGEPMIIVNVNDRLGTKASIPCLASDPIRLFKAQVAARIGRKPHEIMLKRQGERPFKDQLSLEDYGVSNGVQLDLEIDTGD
ncbi:hypothetical protein P7C71_g818, partial [Lecanoromycetidae sp. Uapishka_2]